MVESSGYSEDSVTPKYYDTTTNTWENYDNVVRDAENDRFIIKTDHFSEAGPTGGDVPTAPSGLSATAQSSSSVSLSWTDASSNETGFKVYRGGSLITTTDANTTSYTDSSGLSASTSYSYYVKATNASGDSAATSTVSATTS